MAIQMLTGKPAQAMQLERIPTIDVRYSVHRARLFVDDRTAAIVDMVRQDDVFLIQELDLRDKDKRETIGVAFTRHIAIQFAVAYLNRLGEAHRADQVKRTRIGRVAI
ncbi:MAG: hypothetical protein EVA65_16500 [Oceanococcus sp.]|nr:MAG: hypothetical protein EVA65_16500 [Oceanococcus sp.]